MSRPELCVGAIAVHEDAILLVRRASEPGLGRWSVPGGRVEQGETLAEAVLRELREETGLAGVCGPLVGWVERMGDDHHFVILDFEVTVLDSTEPHPGDDASAARWIDFDDLGRIDLVDGLTDFLLDNGVLPSLR
ncbi:MAG: NUDIX domain-containing protein [Actinomycetota bacterium]|nr:NUDIX domain-containing protein [Actinomycetota bacterium]